MQTPSSMSEFMAGARDTLPLIIAAMPFGIVFGALGQAQGLDVWVILGISILVYAGASQFVAITLLAAGASVPIIILTVFIVNLRHTLYAVTLVPLLKHAGHLTRAFMAFSLTDETFAVVFRRGMQCKSQRIPAAFYGGSASIMYLNWVLCTWIGIAAGNQMPQLTEFGLDIAMVVAFVGIVVPQLTLSSHWLCAITAGTLGLLTYDWPHQSGLLMSALVAIMVGVMTEQPRKADNQNGHGVSEHE